MKQNRFFYGYWIVLVGFFANALSSGIGFYGFSVFNKPIGDDFQWSRSSVAVGFLIYSASVAAFSPGGIQRGSSDCSAQFKGAIWARFLRRHLNSRSYAHCNSDGSVVPLNNPNTSSGVTGGG